MKKTSTQQLLTAVVAAGLTLALTAPAYALTEPPNPDDATGSKVLTSEDGYMNTESEITGKVHVARLISVTVPSTIPLTINTKSGPNNTTVYESCVTRIAEVTNRSEGIAVNLSVARIDDIGKDTLLDKVNVHLTPATSAEGAQAGDPFTFVAGEATHNLVTGLPGLASDGTGNPGLARLALSASEIDETTEVPVGDYSVLATLKVSFARG